MSIDYGEIICTAVDEIITTKLQGLQYDITKLCTIVDDTFSYQGKYTVSDGTARYEAYSSDISYKKGNSVLVTIPNGNYNLQKIIVGRVAAADTAPFNYTPPMDTMIKITNNIFDNARTIYGDNIGLLANEENKNTIIGPLYSISEPGEFMGFTRLGITADFRSWLNGLDVVSGTYGLKVLIYTEVANAPGKVNKNAVYELTFNSSDMIGNPYQFESYFAQEKVFDISNINNIKQIDVYFYQDGQFKDGNGNLIPWKNESTDIFGSSKMNNNLFVNNVKIYLGYESGQFTNETLMLCTNDALSYHYKHPKLQKDIILRWIHKIDDKTFELLDGENLPNNFEVRWFKFKPGCEEIDQYAGKDWERIVPDTKNPFICSFTPDIKKQQEQIKVIGLIKEINTEIESISIMETITPYYSNLLIFENEEEIPDGKTWDAASALSIICLDNSEGNYYIYNQNGKINNEGDGKGHKRYLKAMYQGAEITSSLGKLDWIKWYFPVESTMIVEIDDFYKENEGKKSDVITSYKGVDYDCVTRKAELNNSGKYELPSTKQAYSIENFWSFQNSNNTVRCQVSINGVIYETIEELRFGKGGTNGTNVTFLIEFAENDNALIAENNAIATIKARLYDADGKRQGFTTEQAGKIKWKWYKKSLNNYIELLNDIGSSVQLKSKTNIIPNDNYCILQASYNGLVAYLPIPLKDKKVSFIEGAKEIIYNHQGIPSYYNDAYVVYVETEDNEYKEEQAQWNINWDEPEDLNSLSAGYKPQLKELFSRPGYVAISASPFYASGYNDKVCVSCECWSQPILIMQSKYDFAMLNQWDGSLTINEENGTILSTMLGAGKKNQDNTFSGVLIGNIQDGTNLNNTSGLTGVYGLHEGVLSYALKEDGTATFGKYDKGQILIDGNESIIKSANYNISTNTKGMKIDLNDGIIDIKWPGKNDNIIGQIKLQPTSPYLFINSSNNNNIIVLAAAEDEKYNSILQSDNQSAMTGTKLNLDNGELNIKSEQSNILISGSGSPYFKISIPLNDSDITYSNPLFLLDNNDYYLKSKTYIESDFYKTKDDKKYNIYIQPEKSIVDISETVAVSPSGDVYKVNNNIISGNKYIFQETNKEDKTIPYQTAEQVKQTYLASLIPKLKNSSDITKGFKLDLKNSRINGYDLYLRGINSSLNKSFIFDSSAPVTPIKVANNFSINWDGTLTCGSVNSLNNDGRNGYAISIGNNFYVTKGGAAGGGSGNFGSGSIGGFSSGGVGGSLNGHMSITGDLTCHNIGCASIYSGTQGEIMGNFYDYTTGDISDAITDIQDSIAAIEEDIKTLFGDIEKHTHTVDVSGEISLGHSHTYTWTMLSGSGATGSALGKTKVTLQGTTSGGSAGVG